MHPTKPLPLAAALLATTLALPASSADIDIYAGVNARAAAPNVLFFLDNTSNWSASNQAWNKTTVRNRCSTYTDTTVANACRTYVDAVFGNDSSLTQGQVEVRALKLVLNELSCNTNADRLNFRAGIMMIKGGTANTNGASGGYIHKRVAELDSTHCADLRTSLDSISQNINSSSYKAPSSAEYGSAFFEAFKYFGGWTNPTGARAGTAGSPTSATAFGPIRYSTKFSTSDAAMEDQQAFSDGAARNTYRSPIDTDGACGNNYIILIGNKFPNAEDQVNANATPPTNALMTNLGYNPGAQIYPKPLLNADKSDVRFADEWAKFLRDTDVSDVPGIQNVKTFTIDVFNPDGSGSASERTSQATLLKSIADNGGGRYFAVGGDLYALIEALKRTLSQIAAVDSVFTSASLPVSVNAQGTFLNQVFMGVFRPDGQAQQRWAGNLKQYRFALDNGLLKLVGRDGEQAVDEANTGFIQQCAVSYWSTDSNAYWENVTGYNEANACTTATVAGVTVKPYSDLPDGPIVERGGAGQRLRSVAPSTRNMRTCTSATNCSSLTNFPNTEQSAANATLASWIRGFNEGDRNIGSTENIRYGMSATAMRPTVHGEVVHSRPLAVNYGTSSSNDVVVFYGAGDGTLRAVNGNQANTDGNELWAFVAPEHFANIERVRTNSPLISYPNVDLDQSPTPTPKTYFFDGSIGGYQERSGDTVSKLWIYPTMRRGGSGVYAFDVTKKPSTTATTTTGQPTLLWRYNDSTNSNMGESWSTPVAIRVKGFTKPLVVFGAGYHSCEDNESLTACDSVSKGKGIVILDAESGPGSADALTHNRFIGVATNELDSSAGRFTADVTPVDVNGDGYTDLIYAVDTRGNIWRINTSDPTASYASYKVGGVSSVQAWKVFKIATVGQWGSGSAESERRKFLYSANVVVIGSQATVLVGTGDREKPSAESLAARVKNRFYGIRDNFTEVSSITPVVGYDTNGSEPSTLLNVTNSTSLAATALTGKRGWFRNLSTTTTPYEQVVTTPLTLGGVTYFNTYQAKATGTNQCSNLGTGRAYQIDFQTGSALADAPVVTVFESEGIPPSPVGGVVVIGEGDSQRAVPFIIGGPGATPISPKRVTPNVRANRKPLYRYQRID